jgi:hypothetical protein
MIYNIYSMCGCVLKTKCTKEKENEEKGIYTHATKHNNNKNRKKSRVRKETQYHYKKKS